MARHPSVRSRTRQRIDASSFSAPSNGRTVTLNSSWRVENLGRFVAINIVTGQMEVAANLRRNIIRKSSRPGMFRQIGTLAATVVPFSLEDSSRVPPICRMRSIIPRNPTPVVPLPPASSKFRGCVPLPWSLISRMAVLSVTSRRTPAVGLPECRCTFVRLSCRTRKSANSTSGVSRPNSGETSKVVASPLRLAKPSRYQAIADLRPSSSSMGGYRR